jgi:hypothetical protein
VSDAPAPPVGPRRFVGPTLAALAFALAAGSLAWSPLSLLAVVALVLGAAELRGRAAVAVSVVGGLVVLLAVGRFVVGTAMPSLVGMGRHTTTERAVSELREILWAEDRTVEERKAKGLPLRYAFLHELVDGVGELAPGVTPPLEARRVVPVDDADRRPTTFRAGGYLVRVFLPAKGGGGVARGEADVDPELAARAWVAYAWPERPEAGSKAIFIAEDETICVTDGAAGYVGLDHAPDALAALGGPRLDAPRCGVGRDGATWKPWRNKKPRRK